MCGAIGIFQAETAGMTPLVKRKANSVGKDWHLALQQPDFGHVIESNDYFTRIWWSSPTKNRGRSRDPGFMMCNTGAYQNL